MNLTITRNINNNKFETVIGFENYGGIDITAEDEKELLENYPCVLSYKNISFNGKYILNNGEVVKSETEGEEVNLSFVDKVFPINENLQLRYEIGISQILDTEVKTQLNTKELVCQAKIKLFEDKIQEELKKLINEAKLKNNNFEKESPIKITI